jgi:prolyl oligopeptidase
MKPLAGFTCMAAMIAGVDKLPPPPVAPVRVVTDDYHGTKIDDPYRYFENQTDPEVVSWFKLQADHAAGVLKAIPGRDSLLSRLREIDRATPHRISGIQPRVGGELYYFKQRADEPLPRFYHRSAAGQETLLIDAARHDGPNNQHASLTYCVPSPSGKHVAYGIALGGSEETTIHVWDVAAGKDLPDVIDRIETAYTEPQWLPDGTGFYYVRRRKLPPDAPVTEIYNQTRVLFHRLGTDPEQDPLILAMGSSPDVSLAETDFPSLVLTPGSRFAIAKIKHGDANDLTLYAALASDLGTPRVKWKKICEAAKQVTDFAVRSDDIYLLSADGAPRSKVVRTQLAEPDFGRVELIVPPSQMALEGLAASADALYVNLLDGPRGQVRRLPWDSDVKPTTIALPEEFSSAGVIAARPDVSGAWLQLASWSRTRATRYYDPQTHDLQDSGLSAAGDFDAPPGYAATEVMVPSHDGVLVPLSIVHRKDLELDGSHPILLGGYGAYGFTAHVRYNPLALAWLERGGILAVAHVRGGGEYGKAWHLAGQKATKPNTWKDFIACGEYLVSHEYTSPGRLAGQGGSAGGILIGRAITERPDLFAAALIDVGDLDALRMETTTNGVPNIQEFGSVVTKSGFDALLAMSSYHHVRDGQRYPAVLLSHGINDHRVEPWMSAKMTARLQAATASGKPVLLRIDYAAGHGASFGATKEQALAHLADQWSFLLWQLGDAAFQPNGVK